jgi:hypothetical protein
MNMTTLESLKQGETFRFSTEFLEDNDDPIATTPEQVKSQVVRANGDLVATLIATQGGAAHIINFAHDGSTAKWPAENLRIDIIITRDDDVIATETMIVNVEKAVTK